jgi:hypothetical protein
MRRSGIGRRGYSGSTAPSDYFRRNISGGRHRHSPPRRHRRRQHDVGLGLSAQRVNVSPIAQDPDGDPGTGQVAGGNTARVYNFEVARLTVSG